MSKSAGVVVGVDGSTTSHGAVDWAARDAVLRGEPLTVLHVMPSAAIATWMDLPITDEFWAERDRRAAKVIADALDWVTETISGDPPVEVRHQLATAPAVPTLVDVSRDAELLVVGCRGLGGVAGLLLGSVSSGVVHHAHCPVVLIHDDPLLLDASDAPVVVGIDGSEASDLAVTIAFEEASRRGVDLVAVHVWSDHNDYLVDGYGDSLGQWADETLAERLAGWAEHHPEVVVHRVVEKNDPARRLLDHAEKAQLLVVGSHGRGGLSELVLGSVSSAVAHRARVPVIVARPAAR